MIWSRYEILQTFPIDFFLCHLEIYIWKNIIIHACPSAFSQITTELLPHMCCFWYEQKVTSFFYCLNIFDIGDIWINLFCSWCPPTIKKSGLNSIFFKVRLKIVFENYNPLLKNELFVFYYWKKLDSFKRSILQ